MDDLAARVVSETVGAAPDAVYAFARQMENLPKWASGLASGIEQDGGLWYSQSPMGRVRVDMEPLNRYRVLDHDVTLPDGNTVHNALRVTPAGEGSVLTFVVLQTPGMSVEDLEKDADHVTRDLRALKHLMEKR